MPEIPNKEQLLATARMNIISAADVLAGNLTMPQLEEALLKTRQGHCALLALRQQLVGNPPPKLGD